MLTVMWTLWVSFGRNWVVSKCLYVSVVDVSRWSVSGQGIQPTGLHVGDTATFCVSTVNANPHDLDITVSRSHAADEPVQVAQVGIYVLY